MRRRAIGPEPPRRRASRRSPLRRPAAVESLSRHRRPSRNDACYGREPLKPRSSERAAFPCECSGDEDIQHRTYLLDGRGESGELRNRVADRVEQQLPRGPVQGTRRQERDEGHGVHCEGLARCALVAALSSGAAEQREEGECGSGSTAQGPEEPPLGWGRRVKIRDQRRDFGACLGIDVVAGQIAGLLELDYTIPPRGTGTPPLHSQRWPSLAAAWEYAPARANVEETVVVSDRDPRSFRHRRFATLDVPRRRRLPCCRRWPQMAQGARRDSRSTLCDHCPPGASGAGRPAVFLYRCPKRLPFTRRRSAAPALGAPPCMRAPDRVIGAELRVQYPCHGRGPEVRTGLPVAPRVEGRHVGQFVGILCGQLPVPETVLGLFRDLAPATAARLYSVSWSLASARPRFHAFASISS